MKKKTALLMILTISVVGMLFSGYLSYSELFKKVCAFDSCPIVNKIPSCIYGFFFYGLTFIISLIGLSSKK